MINGTTKITKIINNKFIVWIKLNSIIRDFVTNLFLDINIVNNSIDMFIVIIIWIANLI